MNPVVGVVRVGADRSVDVLGEQDPMASLLLGRAVDGAEPGVYRVTVSGEARRPDIRLQRVCDADRAFAALLCRRDGAESVVVLRAIVGAVPGQEERVRAALPEAAASAMRDAEPGVERWVDVVM